MKRFNGERVFRIFISVVCMFLLVYTFSQSQRLTQLRNDLNSIRYNYEDRISDLQSEINDLENQLEEQYRFTSMKSLQVHNIDWSTQTADIEVSLTLKSSVEGGAVSLVSGSKSYPMTEENGIYTVSMTIPCMEELLFDALIIRSGTTSLSDQLDLYYYPNEYVPYLYIYEADDTDTYYEVISGTSNATVSIDTEVFIDSYNIDSTESLTSGEIIIISDDEEEVDRIPVKLTEKNWNMEEPLEFEWSGTLTQEERYTFVLEVPYSDNMILRNNFATLDTYNQGADFWMNNDDTSILDADGKILYQVY